VLPEPRRIVAPYSGPVHVARREPAGELPLKLMGILVDTDFVPMQSICCGSCDTHQP
jgi:hypothetical protein